MLDLSPEFERMGTDTVYRYQLISDKIHRYPPLNNLIVTFELKIPSINTKLPNKGLELNISAFWNLQAIKSANNKYDTPLIDSIDNFIGKSKLSYGLIFIVQQSLSKIRDIIYEIDALSSKAISDKIFEFEYLDGSEHIRDKLSFFNLDSDSDQK